MLVLTEKQNGVGWIYMNNPASLNSLTAELVADTVAAVREMDADDEVRVIVFSGAGRAFCAGGDLGALADLADLDESVAFMANAGQISEAIYKAAKPVIAMVNGAAAGAGFNLALACDMIFAVSGAKFIQSFTNIGLAPDCGGHYFLPRAIGSHRAKQAMFEAAPITAEQGVAYGFVNAVFAAEDLKAETAKYAEMLAKRAPLALQSIKRVLNATPNSSLDEVLRKEAQANGRLALTADCKEGLAAFGEKRAPEFKGE